MKQKRFLISCLNGYHQVIQKGYGDRGMKECDGPWKTMGSRPRMPQIGIDGD